MRLMSLELIFKVPSVTVDIAAFIIIALRFVEYFGSRLPLEPPSCHADLSSPGIPSLKQIDCLFCCRSIIYLRGTAAHVNQTAPAPGDCVAGPFRTI